MRVSGRGRGCRRSVTGPLLGKVGLFVEVDFLGEPYAAPGDPQAGHNQGCVGGVITADYI